MLEFDWSEPMAGDPLDTLINEAAVTIQSAERKLGRLSEGQCVDLLLDNIPAVHDSEDARRLVKAVRS